MTRSELQDLLATLDLTPSRKLGQNFLIEPSLAAWIVRQLDAAPDDAIVEVGPGTGALTDHLRSRPGPLILVEKDRRLAQYLSESLARSPNAVLHETDACDFDTRTLYPLQPVHLIGNLPYSAGGEILRNFLGIHSPVQSAVLMLQREFAERIAARPRTKAYGLLTLRIQARWDVRLLKHIGPDCFYPRPQVDSTVLRLLPRHPDSVRLHDPRLFDSLIRRGFAQRRKQLRKSLDIEPGRWEALATALEAPGTVRAEELSLDQWIELTRLLDDHPLRDLPQRDDEPFDVVDGENRVTGQATRSEVHRQGLKHRAVHIFIRNKRGELLLQKRSRLKDVHPGRWDSSAAGHLDAGESYEAAAHRELEEELGLTGTLRQTALIPACKATGQEFVALFEGLATGKPRWPASEIDFAQFFPNHLIQSWIHRRPQDFATGFLECWKAASAER